MFGMPLRALGVALLVVLSPTFAFSAEDGYAASSEIDRLWVLVALIKVAMMQIGFMLLECGMVRSKTTINVAQKNLADFMFATGVFWLCGFMFMFGPTVGGMIGLGGSYAAIDRIDPDSMLFLTFQAVFCGTAATIISGAVAERCSFWGYAALSLVIGAVVYPVFGHWAWGAALVEENVTLLSQFGFMDFAGSTVVHSIGAWAALAAIIVIGPRIGRFHSDGTPIHIPGHNPVLSGAGAGLLLVGWIGFNGGSVFALTDAVPGIVANTLIAAVFGGISGLAYGVCADSGKLHVDRAINGLLGGLVAVTAGADVYGLHSAAIVGVIGGAVAQYINAVIVNHFKLDDVVGVIGVHGAAGAAGTVLVAVFAPVEGLAAGGRLAQLAVQAGGVGLAFVWGFGGTWVVIRMIDPFLRMRVPEADEVEGLNTSEHGQTLGTGHLQQLLASMLAEGKTDADLIRVQKGDEAGDLSELFNMLLLRMKSDQIQDERSTTRRLREIARQKARDDVVVAQINEMIDDAAAGAFDSRLDAASVDGVLGAACGGMNRLFDAVENIAQDLNGALARLADGDLKAVMEGGKSGTFGQISDNFNTSVSRFRETQENSSSVMTMMTIESRRTAENAGDALRDIETASRQALGIVSIIEEIAGKTNLLALNASIEASHAGDHGAAFAVVADQVRALAARVTDASKDINRIITSNSETVASGIGAVDEVRATLARIEERIGSLMQDIDEAGNDRTRLAS